MSNERSSRRDAGEGPVAYARTTDRATSHRAAASLSADGLSAVQKAVGLILSRYGPLTDEELIEKYREIESQPGKKFPGATDSSIRTRRKELVDALIVHEFGKKKNSNGRLSTQWSTKRPGVNR